MDFQKEVIDKSYDRPVLVDFWAPWCGPCRVLGPVIEQIAEEQKDRWTLVKVNTEEEQEVAVKYRIQSIPSVKLFHRGEVIAEFMGALPRTSILNWLEEHLPNEAMKTLQQLTQELQAGEALAQQRLETFVKDHPDLREGRLTLAQAIVFEDPARAESLVEDFAMGYKYYDEANYIKDLSRFLQAETDDSPVGKKMAAAQLAAKNKDLEALIQLLIDATTIDKDYQDALPRKTGVALFRTLGTQHPLTKNYRWKFDMVLY